MIMKKILFILFIPGLILSQDCQLSDGTYVESGWYGYDTGDNWCNICFCENGILGCSELECDPQDECESDIDEDGICEDDCEEIVNIVEDCECSYFDPNTYTVYYTIVDEASCTLIETCYCECINDVNNNGICDEEEEDVDCVDDPEDMLTQYGFSCSELSILGCDADLSDFIDGIGFGISVYEICPESCGDCGDNDCPCINPDWIDPFAICTADYNPVIGCDSMIYSNPCIAQAAGITSWINDSSGEVTILEWDCDSEGCTENEESYCIGCELFISECEYIECIGNDLWSDEVITIEDCGDDIEGCRVHAAS